MTIRDKSEEIIVTIKNEGEDTLNVYFDIPKANMHQFFMGNIVPKDSLYRIGLILGEINAQDRLVGTFFYYEKEIPVELIRSEQKPQSPQVKLSGKSKTPKWTFKTGGAIWSSPRMSSNKIVFGSTDGKVYALDKNGGQLLWEFNTGSPIKGSPLIQNGSVCILSKNGLLYKLHLETGSEIWSFKTLNNEVEVNDSPYDDYSSSPIINNGTIYIGSADYNLYAIDEHTGEEKWRFTTEGMISSTPLVDDNSVYVGSMDNWLYSVDRKTGVLIWKFDTHGPVISSPLSYKNLVIIGSRNSDLYALQKDTGSPEWIYSYWTSWVESSGIIVDDRLYIGSSDSGNVYCLDPTTGEEYWTSFVGGSAWGNPAFSANNLYTGVVGTVGYSIDHKGAFVCLDASSGMEKWRFDYQPTPDQLTFGVYSTPLVSDGMVLFGGLDEVFYAFEE